MEVDVVPGNEEVVTSVGKYWVVGRDDAGTSQPIEWKADMRRFPKVNLRGGNYVHSSEENLQKTFKEGDYIMFLDLGSGGNGYTHRKDRKV